MLKLLRVAASGGQRARGTADHLPRDFTIQFASLFSCVVTPPLLPQELQRTTVLELNDLVDTSPPSMEPHNLRAIGAGLRRRMVDHWPRLPATFKAYHDMLIRAGHRGRSADQLGTLLACADLVLNDGDKPPTAEQLDREIWRTALAPQAMAEGDDALSQEQRCLRRLLTFVVDAGRAADRRSISQIINAAIQENNIEKQNQLLATFGLRIGALEGCAPAYVLWVANSHTGFDAIFRDTDWRAPANRTSPVAQLLRRLPLARKTQQRIGGVTCRVTELPLCGVDSILPDEID